MGLHRTERDWGIVPPVGLDDAHTLTLPAEAGRARAGGALAALAALAPPAGADLALAMRVGVDADAPRSLTLTF